MGRETVVTFFDDMTGKPMERSELRALHVLVDGWAYPLEVSEASYTKYIQPLIKASGPRVRLSAAGGTVAPIKSAAPLATAKEHNAKVREWWARQVKAGRGLLPAVTERGRIPADVVAKYTAYEGQDIAPPPKRETDRAAVEKLADDFNGGKKPRATTRAQSAAFLAPNQDAPEAAPSARKRAAVAKAPAQRGSKAPAKAATPAASRARKRT